MSPVHKAPLLLLSLGSPPFDATRSDCSLFPLKLELLLLLSEQLELLLELLLLSSSCSFGLNKLACWLEVVILVIETISTNVIH